MKRSKALLCLAACLLATEAGAATISFNLTGAGYTQDSPVAANLFQGSGLMLSSGVVTACGGECISNPAGVYNGSISGDFMGAAYRTVEFIGATGNATISLFDLDDNLVENLTWSGRLCDGNYYYLFWGTIGIASFTANLGYDGLFSIGFEDSTTRVPEPASLLLLGISLGVIGVATWRRRPAP
jgi:hypothetical protein